jgi:hypothetical protein
VSATAHVGLTLSLVLGLGACGAPPSVKPSPKEKPVQFLDELTSVDDFDSLRGQAGDVNILAQVVGSQVTPPILESCEFENTKLYAFHLPFLNAQPGGEHITYDEYTNLVIRSATRVWWGGQVIWLPATKHPLTHETGVLAWQVYTEDSNGNRLTLDDVRAAYTRISICTPGFAHHLAMSPYSDEQTATLRAKQDELASEGIAVLLP